MWPKWLKGSLTNQKIIEMVKVEGSLVGERQKGSRKVFIYLLKDFFVQIMFKEDNPIEEVEHLLTFSTLDKLNAHLEKEFRTAF